MVKRERVGEAPAEIRADGSRPDNQDDDDSIHELGTGVFGQSSSEFGEDIPISVNNQFNEFSDSIVKMEIGHFGDSKLNLKPF